MRGARRWGVLAAGVAAVVALVGTTGGTASVKQEGPIVIGWAFDAKGQMAPFDGPALATAKIRVKEVNAKGGVDGRRLRLDTCDTQNNNPARAKSCARRLLSNGADIIFTTCDVDFATPVVQEAINRGVLAVSTCIGTDQMGPKRFGKTKGRLAFSFGNVAQDEGSAMAEYAYKRGWRNAGLATNTLLVYFKNVVQAFEKRFTQLGGKVVARENYATGAEQRPDGGRATEQPTCRRLRHLDRVRRAAGVRLRVPLAREPDADPQLVGGRRDVLGHEEPAGDELLRGHIRVGVR